MTSLYLYYQGGHYNGMMASITYEGNTPREIRLPLPGSAQDQEKVPCAIYSIRNVEDAPRPMRGLRGQAVFLREAESYPGLVHPV